MQKGGLKFLIRATAVVLVLISCNILLLHRLRAHESVGIATRASWYNLAGQTHELLGYIGQWNSIVRQNESLKTQLQQQQSQQTAQVAADSNNQLLKFASNLSARIGMGTIPAGIYNLTLTPDGYAAMLNKGSDDGIAVGDTVVSDSGVLVGAVSSAFSNSSRVLLVQDPSFTVTVQVSGSKTSGIARGALDKGMNLELITQSDTITEGDQLVSTGDDHIPAGIIVGSVSNVTDNSTQIFKNVSVKPAVELTDGSVLVIKQ